MLCLLQVLDSYRSPSGEDMFQLPPFYEFLVALQFRSPALRFENRLALGEVLSDDAGSLQPGSGVLDGIRSCWDHLEGGRRQEISIWLPGVIQTTESVSCVFSILLVISSNRTIGKPLLAYGGSYGISRVRSSGGLFDCACYDDDGFDHTSYLTPQRILLISLDDAVNQSGARLARELGEERTIGSYFPPCFVPVIGGLSGTQEWCLAVLIQCVVVDVVLFE